MWQLKKKSVLILKHFIYWGYHNSPIYLFNIFNRISTQQKVIKIENQVLKQNKIWWTFQKCIEISLYIIHF